MILKKILLSAAVAMSLVLVSCQRDPSTSDLNQDYMVYTDRDTTVDFSDYTSFYIPDSILLIGTSATKTEYWSDENAQAIIDQTITELEAKGFTYSDDKSSADLGIQLSYVERVSYFVGSTSPNWWWNYPYYWSPGYWGSWMGWHYPYQVYYGYTAGSLLTEMVDLNSEATTTSSKLTVVWDSFIGGLMTSNQQVNQQRTLEAIEQAFEQSPYL